MVGGEPCDGSADRDVDLMERGVQRVPLADVSERVLVLASVYLVDHPIQRGHG